MTLLAFMSTVLAALYACFGFPGNAAMMADRTPPEEAEPVWNWIDAFMEISFALDIFLHFFVQYYDQDSRKPVRDLKKIAISYITHRFPIDLIATFPWVWIFNWQPRHLRLLYICRWIRFTKLATITDLQKF